MAFGKPLMLAAAGVLIALTAAPTVGLSRGLGGDFSRALAVGGWQNAAQFGGSGPRLLGSLGRGEIWLMALPGDGEDYEIGLGGDGLFATSSGASLFLTEPAPVPLPGGLGLALGGVALLAWRRRAGTEMNGLRA